MTNFIFGPRRFFHKATNGKYESHHYDQNYGKKNKFNIKKIFKKINKKK